MSRSTAAHSITKTCETDVNPAGERSRRQKLPSPCDAHVHGGVALHRAGQAAVGLLAPRLAAAVGAGTPGTAPPARRS